MNQIFDFLFSQYSEYATIDIWLEIIAVIFGFLSLGVLFGYTIAVFSVLSSKAQNRNLQNKIKNLTKELNDLRNVAVNETVYQENEG